MEKAASVFLRSNVTKNDTLRMMQWMANPSVTRYLNEDPHILTTLEEMYQVVPEPMLTFRFNRRGRFYLICREQEEAIGFLKLVPGATGGAWEIVVAIGDDHIWGHGYGTRAIRLALSECFFHWENRAKRVIANIHVENDRSIRAFRHLGFHEVRQLEHCQHYELTQDDYLHLM